MPLPDYVEALRRASIPSNPNWFGYRANDPTACEAAASSLRARIGLRYEREDIFLTRGATNAIGVALSTILNPGDEVIFPSPPWFFYEALIAFARGVPIRVPVDRTTFDLDVESIRAALTPRTRAIIVNSPNNPTGKVYPPETLTALARVLTTASEQYGKVIYLLSDESYNRILFDGRPFHSPTAFYPHSVLIYSYAKVLLTPGQRLGYLALPPSMPNRQPLRRALFAAQCCDFSFPDAVLQHALPELETIGIDLEQLQRRRNVLVDHLRGRGYQVHNPEGAWYLLPRSPLPDDQAFVELLAEQNVYVLPGRIVELPGYFRISLTASDAMVARSLAGFTAAIESVRKRTTTR
jgi:aspartate aminotransferase